jgi:hypothetical protein
MRSKAATRRANDWIRRAASTLNRNTRRNTSGDVNAWTCTVREGKEGVWRERVMRLCG